MPAPSKTSRFPWQRLLWVLLALAIAAAVLWWRSRPPVVPGYKIETRNLVQNVVATGYVITPSRVQVASEITGTVVKRLVDRGAHVKAGQVLLELRADQTSAQLDQARAALRQLVEQSRPQAAAALAQAKVQVEQAERDLKRAQGVFDAGGGSAQQLEQAQTALRNARQQRDSAQAAYNAVAPGGAQQRVLEAALNAASAVNARNVVRAGVSGVVLARNVEVGDTVTPGQTLFTLAMDGATEILLPVNEQSIGNLQIGQQAQCVADAYPDRSFAAQVSFLAPQVDRTTGTLEVRLRVPQPPPWLKQDMTVSADIVTAQRRNTLVVPNDALRSVNGDQATVLVLRGGRAQAQQVKLGLQGLTLTQVVSGLSSGESVLAGNSVAPGERVRLQTLPLPSAAASSAASGNDLPMPGR
ncbi:MAG: efflux RND transporter periplasmic adaptor subunit [Thiomonas arsenitoxydans]|uniref:Efflux RND transporter periplasmic adaptor subunit n=1 Tax=Thiomonas arsenitoxydans (strain DSM 22701 / CIP 110005 / 3As) TaxID=426114 RepID=A0A8I1MW08_THIA3|nr:MULTISPECIES: efflux RND transporter periplasmic adaptor subunit [Thiomonas]MBN8744179.1 efflux RND transporter periplasmic adaptor subunit [Thiomonas arsenitoxydans]ODU95421.1 MAG: efflux transporter periplasmic adaptor subunit [Thiomonas sp. SCN 64-16]